MAIVHWKQV